ncbi:MAG: TonB-dependent receptor, partial [Bacteroidota bacterium]
MRFFFTLVLTSLLSVLAMGQSKLSGVVINAAGETLPAATIVAEGDLFQTVTDVDGNFEVGGLPDGSYQLYVSFLGYQTLRQEVIVDGTTFVKLTLREQSFDIGEVTVYGNWADEKTPMTYTNFSKEEIEANNLGQDVPFLLRWSPSVVVTSDAGTGIGYTGIRVRGSDPTRINVTINGIPLNDAESQGTFWVDLPDFITSTDNVQIQRGVGTSTNGAGAFGATLNLSTNKVHRKPYASVNTTVGSFNTQKYNVTLGSGLLNNKFTFDGRLSRISSDGFIDRGSADLRSWFASGAYLGKKASLRFNAFSGHEVTYQAWNGVPAQFVDDEELRTFNTAGTERSGEPHDNEVDDYTQTHYQLHYNQIITDAVNLNVALHYTRGFGFFEQYKAGQNLLDYGLTPANGIEETDLIRRRWLDNDFYGTIFSLNYQPTNGKLDFTLGGGWNNYEGKHFGEVIWARFMSQGEQGQRYYDNDGEKQDFNIFAQANYQFLPKLNAYLDLQLRSVDYTFLGFDNNGRNVTQNDQLRFFNPKAGLVYQLKEGASLYASFGVANREPNRSDYTESTPDSRPEHETLFNTELGLRQNWKRAMLNVNLYHMAYNNQLVLTGQINDVGEYTRTNVDDSYRLGLELDGSVLLSDAFSLSANATFSQNRIQSFTEYIDNWDTWGQEAVEHENTNLAFSPGVIAGVELRYNALADLAKADHHELIFSLLGKYVG